MSCIAPAGASTLGHSLWAFPAVLAMGVVYGYSIFKLIEEATHRDGNSVGLDNLKIAYHDPFFRQAIGNNVRLLLTLPIIIGLALLIAILLYEGMTGWRFHRVAIFIPYMLPVAVVGVLFGQLLTLNGALNSIARHRRTGLLQGRLVR